MNDYSIFYPCFVSFSASIQKISFWHSQKLAGHEIRGLNVVFSRSEVLSIFFWSKDVMFDRSTTLKWSKLHGIPSFYQERGHLQLDPAHIFTVLVKDKTSLPSQVLLSTKSCEEIRKL